MPAADLPALEQRLEACLIELERLYEARPRMSDALGRAGAGQTNSWEEYVASARMAASIAASSPCSRMRTLAER